MQIFAYQIHADVKEFQTHASFVVPEPRRNELTAVVMTPFRRIEAKACKVFKVTPRDIRGERQCPDLRSARQFIYYWSARLTTMSLAQIGRLLGNRDHSTVAYGRNAYIKKRAKMGRHLREVR